VSLATVGIATRDDHRSRSAGDFSAELLALIPQLRAFARMLTGERDGAEDLAQEALAKALQFQTAFQPGTNLRAWLFTIARNEFLSKRRAAWRIAPYDEAAVERIASDGADQVWSLELSDTLRALQRVPNTLREALLLVGASGCSCEEAAAICGCAVGTIKSRVWRARRALAAILNGEPSGDDARLDLELTGGEYISVH
jgi:RNA polymerase sigma-70 factor (ECF subfamily)